jgi:hypothetical protein
LTRSARPLQAAPIVALLLWSLLTWAGAQPYAASGGFDRARLLGTANGIPGGAVAVDGGRPYAYWDDGTGVVRRPLDLPDAESERVVDERSVRLVLAASGRDEAAVAWVRRALDSGRSEYLLRWRGETRLVANRLVQDPVALAIGPSGPALLLVERAQGRSSLELYRWSGDVVRIRNTDVDLAGPSLVFDDEGGAVIAWLEGEVIRSEFGVESEWDAYAAYAASDGEVSGVTELGQAANDGIQFTTRVDWPTDGPQVAWTDPRGALMVARPGEEPTQVGRGHPIGVHDGAFYWSDGTSIVRRPLGNDAAPEERVVWSPNEPERLQAVSHLGHLHMVWYGGNLGGGFAVYAADDREPIRLGLRDRIAARMGWSPWEFWQSLAGQSLFSLVGGLLITMALFPLILIASLLLSRAVPAGSGTTVGLMLGAIGLATLVAVASVIVVRSGLPYDLRSLFGSWDLAIVVGIGSGAAWLIRRRADSETVFAIVSSASISSIISVALIGFLHYRSWLGLWSAL